MSSSASSDQASVRRLQMCRIMWRSYPALASRPAGPGGVSSRRGQAPPLASALRDCHALEANTAPTETQRQKRRAQRQRDAEDEAPRPTRRDVVANDRRLIVAAGFPI